MNKFFEMIGAVPQQAEGWLHTAQLLTVSLLATLVLSAVMMLCYRLCHDSLTYNRKFNTTLMMLALSATILFTLIGNNPMFSLGALGALSICRIRTNTRDPRDLGFVFWSLMIGISSALGAFAAGALGTMIIGTVLLIFTKLGHRKKGVTLIVRGEKEQLPAVETVFQSVRKAALCSENVFRDSFEVVYDIDLPQEEERKLMEALNGMPGIRGVNLLAPQTEVA